MSHSSFAKTSRAVLLCAALAAAGPAFAHHSGAMYDSGKQVTLTGTIAEFNWTNPHVSVVIEVPGPDGKVTKWDIEGSSPNLLVRQGWKKSSFKTGDKVSVTVHPMRNGSSGGVFMNAVLADGSKLPQAAGSTGGARAG